MSATRENLNENTTDNIKDVDDIEFNFKNSINNLNNVEIQKAIFIYNAINNGWVVKKMEGIDKNRYDFRKNTKGIKHQVNMANYVHKFIKYNLNISNMYSS
jgi:hypothetical protein